jgi:hypothetical protein
MSRFKGRPMDGLPGRLPAGEKVLWQAGPDWRALARQIFKIRVVGIYFAALIVWRIYGSMSAGHDLHYALVSALSCVALGAAGVALFCLFAWLIARTTTYTITQKRVVITYGMALPKSLNLPFSKIDGASLAIAKDGTGNISLKLPAEKRLAYLLLWPHVRTGAQGRAEPVLRCIPNPEAAAQILAAELRQTITSAPAKTAAPASQMAHA